MASSVTAEGAIAASLEARNSHGADDKACERQVSCHASRQQHPFFMQQVVIKQPIKPPVIALSTSKYCRSDVLVPASRSTAALSLLPQGTRGKCFRRPFCPSSAQLNKMPIKRQLSHKLNICLEQADGGICLQTKHRIMTCMREGQSMSTCYLTPVQARVLTLRRSTHLQVT